MKDNHTIVTQAEKLAAEMYKAIFPEMDDKHHAALTKGEMVDWMLNGDTALLNTVTAADMVAEWNDYNGMMNDAGEQ